MRRFSPWFVHCLAWSRRNPSALLFAVQIIGILVYPAMSDTGAGRAAFNAFGVVVVLLALRVVRFSPGLTPVGVVVALPATVLLIIRVAGDYPQLAGWASGFEAALYFYAAGCMIWYILADLRITKDELWAVGSTFTLLAWAFAHVFIVCQQLTPGAFTAAVNSESNRTWVELLFLSVTNLSSTGLSDVAPIKPLARSLVMIEQIVGVGYVVMLVSRVVALTISSARDRDQRRGAEKADSEEH